MKKLILFLGILLTFSFTGCGYKEGVKTSSAKAHLYFTGNTENVVVSVDGSEKFNVKSGADNLYNITPGKHIIEVYRGDTLVVKREIFISDGISKEIEVR